MLWVVLVLVRVVFKLDLLFQILLLCNSRLQVYISEAKLLVRIWLVLFAHRGVEADDALVEVPVNNLGELGEGRLLNVDKVVLLVHSRR